MKKCLLLVTNKKITGGDYYSSVSWKKEAKEIHWRDLYIWERPIITGRGGHFSAQMQFEIMFLHTLHFKEWQAGLPPLG